MGQDEALLASTALAALAAGAAWLSALQSRKIARAATLPDLSIQLIVREVARATGRVEAVIHNAGNGAARGVSFLIIEEDTVASNYGPRGGILRANEMLLIQTSLQVRMPRDGESAFAIVSCRDRDGFTHIRTHEEEHNVLRARWWPFRPRRHGNLGAYVRRHHGIDTESLDRASATVTFAE